MEYLNNRTFTELFQDTQKNHNAICLGLKSICDGVAKKYGTPHHWEDQATAALLMCIEKISHFDNTQKNAFAYFTQIAINEIRMDQRTERYERKKIENIFIENGEGERMVFADPLPTDGPTVHMWSTASMKAEAELKSLMEGVNEEYLKLLGLRKKINKKKIGHRGRYEQIPKETIEYIEYLAIEEGFNGVKISQITGVSPSAVCRHIPIKIAKGPELGTIYGTRTTTERIEEIRRLFQGGLSKSKIRKQLKIHFRVIQLATIGMPLHPLVSPNKLSPNIRNERNKRIKEMLINGITGMEIMRQLKINNREILNVKKEMANTK